jgi:hypothetical protein
MDTRVAKRIASVAFVVGTLIACNGTTEAEERCSTYCANLPTVCPAALAELKGRNCETTCVDAKDSSLEFKQCLANARSCEELAACKTR